MRENYLRLTVEITAFQDDIDTFLSVNSAKFNEKGRTFIRNLIKNKDFLSHPEVPTDNNGSERAVRNMKVKTKISDQFRNKEGKVADRFAGICSVIDTTIKNGKSVYSTLLMPSQLLTLFNMNLSVANSHKIF